MRNIAAFRCNSPFPPPWRSSRRPQLPGLSRAFRSRRPRWQNQTVYQDPGAAAAKNTVPVATHAPTRLSTLAGNDDAAWADAGHAARKPR